MTNVLDETLKGFVINNKAQRLRQGLQGHDIDMPIFSDLDPKLPDGSTLLMYAVAFDRSAIIDLLISLGCDLNAQDEDERTALMLACQQGNLHIVQRLISAGANVDLDDAYALTALAHAARYDHPHVVRFLLAARGINPDIVNQDPQSRAEMNALDASGNTLLMSAVRHGYCTTEIIQMLVNIGCDVNAAREMDGNTPLLIRVDYNCDDAIVEALIGHGANVNAADLEGRTPIMKAAIFNHPSTVSMLLRAGANINAVDHSGNTVLMRAVSGLHIQAGTIRFLLDNGCVDTINNTNNNGESALARAVGSAKLEIVRLLLGVAGIHIDMRKCREALDAVAAVLAAAAHDDDEDENAADNIFLEKIEECLREVAATVIQRQWRECYYNPNYAVCQRRLMEEGESMERDVKRLRRE